MMKPLLNRQVIALGKKGEVSLKMRELGQMSPEERQSVGPALNELKKRNYECHICKKSGTGRLNPE